MVHRGSVGVPARVVLSWVVALATLVAGLAIVPAAANAQESKRLLLYTGTTGYRHTDAINLGRPVVQDALEEAGYTVDWEDCNANGGGANNCDNANKNPRIFTDENLARYDAIVLFNSSAGPPGPLWSDAQKASIIKFVQNGGGIAGVHNATDMGTGQETWDWWDGNNPNSAVGSTMAGHAATDRNNVAQVQVEDHNHLATRDLPDTWGFGDEHYNFRRNVRGDHHVLATLDERTYNPGGNGMGQDHPITWCRLYDGDNINDNTGTPKSYNDGRVWVTGQGHFGASFTENGGDNNLVKMIVGGTRWVAGEGRKSDCSGTVWSSFTRTVVVPDANNPIGIDVAKDGKIYWSEIGNPISLESTGYVKMHDPQGEPGNKTTVISIPTRADHGNSEDGVLGFALQPGFDLSDPDKRNVFVYYSPRNAAWPTSGDQQVVGWNQISRFTLTEDGKSAVPGSERLILKVPKAKISGNPSGFEGGPRDSGPGHVGGAGLDFDSDGNLYLGVGDDVSPNAPGHNGYTPMDFRAKERWDARKTAANTADLRGKIIRITPKQGAIPADAESGVGATYDIPDGNMFPVGTAKTRPEIYAMGFRQPFTVHTDPKNPGIVGMGEYCHDNSSNGANRSPAGICEWNLIKQPGFFGWPFCMGDDSPANTNFRWNYATNSSTGQQYDCSLSELPSDIRWAPEGQTPVEPTHDGLDTLPGPAVKATIWKKYGGASGGQSTADFGDLNAGGMQPITGPIYRYDEQNAQPGAFPRYYDGSWFINNRGADNGFWKEVKLRKDNNEMLRVQDWLPYNSQATSSAQNSSLVIGSTFGPDGSLYMARFSVGCCRSGTNANQQNQIVKISFNVQDECLTDEAAPNTSHSLAGQAYPGEENTFVNEARLTLTANDSGCSGVDSIEYRVKGTTEWHPYESPIAYGPGEYEIEYRATDRMENVSAAKTATFEVLEIHDETAPTATATTSGNKDQRDFFVGSASLAITAEDDATGSGVDKIEYRINGGSYTTYTAPVGFNTAGEYTVDYRATDKIGNTSEPKTVTFRIITGAGCTQARSDEFSGSALGAQWLRHTRNGGTPDSALTFGNGQLRMLTADFELDAAAANTSVGPVNFIGQDLASLGDSWQVETEFTVNYTGGWQNTGLIVWNGDNNFFRSSITHDLNNGYIYVEQSKDNPTSAEGARSQAGGNIQIVPNKQPVTIRMRYTRSNGSNTVVPQYRVMAPASAANDDWQSFGGAANFLDLNPSGGPRRDAEGSRIGIIAGSNFPGTSGAHAYTGTPGTVDINYFRVSPDPVTCETDAPTTTATLDPAAPAAGDTYDRSVKVNLSATDTGSAGVEKTEYRITTDGREGDWKTLTNSDSDSPFVNQVTVSESGTHVVEFRSTDKAANVETTKSVTFKIQLPVCNRSDEFDGDEILPRWLRHTRNGGTPTTGPLAPTVSGGQLHLPTNDFEIDAAAATTSVGPINFLGQDLAQLGDSWSVETQFTVKLNGGWQNVGLIVWNGDNNFFRSTISHSLSGGNLYVESSKDNPTTAEGSRQTAGGNVTILPNHDQAVTIKMRYRRVDGANNVQAHYQVVAPASVANDDWVAFPNTSGTFLDLNPSSGPRRDAEGSRIGLLAQDNWPGQGGTFPADEPAVAHVDYFRVTPDDCPVGEDTTAPTTTAALDPAEPGPGGTYEGPVTLTLNATDDQSGVESTEYRVNDAAPFGALGPATLAVAAADWVTYDPANKPRFAAAGTYSIDYRSTDKAGNVEAAKTVTFTIAASGDDSSAPVTTATLDPATPGPGRTYSGPVTVKFSANDPAPEGPAAANFDVDASGDRWAPDAVALHNGDKITWHFGEEAVFPHDVWVVKPGGNQNPTGGDLEQVTEGIVFPGADPVSKTFTTNGTWTFICKVHAIYDSASGTWAGMVGTANVTAADGGGEGPSGVNYTEYRVKTGDEQGDWVRLANTGGANPFASEATISAEGQHTVEYRSVDNAGNTEATKTVSFGIDLPEPGNPVIQAFADPTSGQAPLLVRFSATGYDPDGGPLTYKWDFGNGTFYGAQTSRTFSTPGTYTVTVTATDDEGDTTSTEVVVTVTGAGIQPPTVEASSDVETIAAGGTVQFTADGADPDTPDDQLKYRWDFGDGLTSLEQNPAHVYALPGTYIARVTVTDPSGATASDAVTITVTAAPGNQAPVIRGVGADPNAGTAPLSVQFSIDAVDPDGDKPLTYTWDFGDGSATVTGASPKHTFTEAGTYEVKVTVSDGKGGSSTGTVSVVVGDPPGNQAPAITEIAADPISGVSPLTVRFSSDASDPEGEGMIYRWDFGDGSFGGGPAITHTYTGAGVYTATLTVTDPHGGQASKTVTITVTASQGAPAPDAGTGNGAAAGTGDSAVKGAESSQTAAPAAWLGVSKPAKTTVARFSSRGLSFKVTSTRAARGTAKITISRKLARRLGLKSTTLATVSVKFSGPGVKTVTVKPSAKVKRALRKAKGSLKVKLGVSLKASGKSAKSSTRTVTLARR